MSALAYQAEKNECFRNDQETRVMDDGARIQIGFINGKKQEKRRPNIAIFR